MQFSKLLLVLAFIGFAYYQWGPQSRNRAPDAVADAADAAGATAHGFVAMPRMDGVRDDRVTVIAAEDCPEAAAQRADGLAAELARQGVPVTRSHSVSFSMDGSDPGAAQRVMAMMNGELPIVMVRGRAKSNPSVQDVVAEWRGSAR